ncbi:hypothetical protein GQ53DRAFT_815275 [Thozetella sp. PMI_491]|nr:hypothetical protein GQ53DRAFT_815275 [Thozetella sp. PMI_491]
MSLLKARETSARGMGVYRRWNGTILDIPLHIHAVVPSDAKDQYLGAGTLFEQVEVMNKAFAPSNIHFTLQGTTRTADDKLINLDVESPEPQFDDFWRATRQGDYGTLNLWIYPGLVGGESVLAGSCEFPKSNFSEVLEKGLYKDGCHIQASTLPGGTPPFDMGITAVHETGHWFGLFHVFDDDGMCNGKGDLIDDTPAQAVKTDGCPAGKDTCPDMPGRDSITNYMDYSDDSCYEGFTAGQLVRMHNSYDAFRYGKGAQVENTTSN